MPSLILSKITNKWVSGGLNTFINPFSYLILRKKDVTVRGMDAVLIDGQLLIVFFKLLGVSGLKRKSFDMTSLATEVFDWATENSKTIYLVGTAEELITQAADNICTRFPGLKVVGYHHGFLDAVEERYKVFAQINNLKADIVVAGMGTPRQEDFLSELKETGWEGTGFTCGGFFHQTAKGIQYYPPLADRFHLRWAYRIYDEPKLFVRYFVKYPLSLVLIVWDLKLLPALKGAVKNNRRGD